MLMDIYVLANERSATMVERFLARFLPERVRADADYTVCVSGDETVAVFGTPEELTTFCESQPHADGRAYWNGPSKGDPRSAHVFFLPDGGLVLGLSVAATDEAAWNRWLSDLRSFTGSEYGYWTGECPPENTVCEFVARAEKARRP
jgi:hypothetical protein